VAQRLVVKWVSALGEGGVMTHEELAHNLGMP
jgi:hypothetical protein